MSKNITYQLTSSVDNAFCPGADKHSDKRLGIDDKVYSYSSRKSLLDMSFTLGRFIIDNYPDIRKIKDINIAHINDFLASRGNVTQATMTLYKSLIHKLEILSNKKFGNHVDWHTGIKTPAKEKEKIRTCMISQNQVDLLMKHLITKRDCASKDGVLLALSFALRVTSITKLQARDVRFNDDGTCILHIHEDKGKRNRDIIVEKKDDVALLKRIVGNKVGNQRLIPVKSASINVYARRCFKEMGFTNLLNNKTSIHAIRKYRATQYVNEKEKEVGRAKAIEMAISMLGHGKEREDLKRIYILK